MYGENANCKYIIRFQLHNLTESVSMDKIRVGVVGAGAMGQHHARVYYELPGVELVGVADVNEENAKKNAEPYGAEHYIDHKELLGKVDAVSVVVPTQLHKQVALEFLNKGVHTLVEKPIAFTLEEADEMINAGKANNALLAIGHIERFNPAVREVKEILKNEKIIQIDTIRCGPPVARSGNVDVVLDLMTHDIDIVSYLTESEPKDIIARGGKLNSERENYAVAIMTMENNIMAILSANRITQKKTRKLRVTCENKLIELDYVNQDIDIYQKSMPEYVVDSGKVTYKHDNIIEKVEVQRKEPLRVELQSFVDSIRNKKEPEVNGVVGEELLKLHCR